MSHHIGGKDSVECTRCNGTGRLPVSTKKQSKPEIWIGSKTCIRCKGTGKVSKYLKD